MYEIDLSNARLAALRKPVQDDLARYMHSEYREHDADWLLSKREQRQ